MIRPLRNHWLRYGWLCCRPVMLFGLLGLVGCGGGSSSPQTPVPVVVQDEQPRAGGAGPVAAGPQQPAGAPATAKKSSSASQKSGDAPGEDTENLFVAGDVGSPMQVTQAPEVQNSERFTVERGVPETNSSEFVVAAALGSAATSPRTEQKLPAGFTAVTEYGYADSGHPLRIRGDVDGKLLAFVPGGAVRVGSDDGPAEASPEFVTFLDPYYMDVTEVTVGEYERFRQVQRDAKKSRLPSQPLNASSGSRQPALGITWGDASNYTKWAGKDLPTEAQFELAARGPDGFPHPWGTGRPVWNRQREVSTITPVALFAGDVSPYGIYDLAGNAREWMQDWYTADAHREASKISQSRTLTNWAGPRRSSQTGLRVVKGAGPQWQVWYRWPGSMGDHMPDVGFRCVLNLSAKTTPEE